MKNVIDQLFSLQQLEFPKRDKSPEGEARIQALRTAIPAPILGHYDRLLQRGKKGVAVIRNGVCTECHMRVAIGVLATVMRREDIQLCGNCGRYLYLPPEVPVPAATPAPAPAAAAPEAKPAARKRKPKTVANVQ